MGLVGMVARRMLDKTTLPLEELTQIGSVGLIKAVERFDPNQKKKLSSYAVPFIQGAILQFLRDKARTVKIPRGLQETYQKIKRLMLKDGVTYDRAAAILGIDPGLAKEADIACNQFVAELPDSLSSEEIEEFESILPLLDKLPEDIGQILRSLYIDKIPIKELCSSLSLKINQVKKLQQEGISQLKLIVSGRVKCPNCSGYETVKNGKRGVKQSYLCRTCSHQFVENPLPIGRKGYEANLKVKVLEAIASGKSLYWCEAYLGIDHSTAHFWRENYAITSENLLSKKLMTAAQQQWEITSKFTGLVDYLVKKCPESPELDQALQLLNQAMQKSQQAVGAKK